MGFWDGNSTPPNNPSSSSSTSNPIFSSSSASNSSSNQIRQRMQTEFANQMNIANAKFLISKVNENCFDNCITAPGSTLSSKENSCLSSCMEKYIEAWNVTSQTYIARLQKEGANMSGVSMGPSSGM